MIKDVIKGKYKYLIITNFDHNHNSQEIATTFPSKFSKNSRTLIKQKWINLFQFFIKSENSFCCLFLGSSSWTVSSIHHLKPPNSWLFKCWLTMVIWFFLQLESCWIDLAVAFSLLKLILHLFQGIALQEHEIHHCLRIKVPNRISWFC
jgi:hypothetical protein